MRTRVLASLTIAAVAVPLGAATAPAHADADRRPYRGVDLGTLGGGYTAAAAMNESGTVVGTSETADGRHHAFAWRRGRMVDLGTLPGGSFAAAYDVNERGMAVGISFNAAQVARATLWHRGRVVDLGTLGGASSSAIAVNDRGQVLGEAEVADGRTHRFLWEDGVMTDLGEVEIYTQTTGLNNRGEIIGTVNAPPYGYPCSCRATLWRGDRVVDIGSLGATDAWIVSYPEDINDRGVVVGFAATPDGFSHAFRWRAGVITDLGTLGGSFSFASAVNAAGVVAGNAETAAGVHHPVLWRGTTVVDLTTRGLTADDILVDLDDARRLVANRGDRAMFFR